MTFDDADVQLQLAGSHLLTPVLGVHLQKPDARYNIQLAKQLHGLEHHKVIWVKPTDIKASHLLLIWADHHAAPARVAAANAAQSACCGS